MDACAATAASHRTMLPRARSSRVCVRSESLAGYLLGARQSQTHRSIVRQTGSTRAFSTSPLQRASPDSTPRIVQPSIWQSIIPRALRESRGPRRDSASRLARWRAKEWNPATVYIIFSLLIGSQAIQTIALRNEAAGFARKADAKIGLLKEVIERVRRGEAVDVEGLLGTGNRAKEQEWEEGEALSSPIGMVRADHEPAAKCSKRLKKRTCSGSPRSERG